MEEKMDRDKVIKKLKDIKDPVQRDRIIWALAGKEKDDLSEKPAPMKPKSSSTVSAPRQEQKLPQLPANARKMFNYVVPVLFFFFGIVNLIQALMHFKIRGQLEDAIPKLIMGLIFFVFGIFGIIKARKQVQGVDADQTKT